MGIGAIFINPLRLSQFKTGAKITLLTKRANSLTVKKVKNGRDFRRSLSKRRSKQSDAPESVAHEGVGC
jgi:hypothetical protein